MYTLNGGLHRIRPVLRRAGLAQLHERVEEVGHVAAAGVVKRTGDGAHLRVASTGSATAAPEMVLLSL